MIEPFYAQLPNQNEERKNPNVIFPIDQIVGHHNAIFEINWFDSDTKIGSVCGDFLACIHDVNTKKLLYTLSGHSGSIRAIDSYFSNTDLYVTGGKVDLLFTIL